jgi:hypothetical protein
MARRTDFRQGSFLTRELHGKKDFFSAVRARLTFANDFDYAEPIKCRQDASNHCPARD